MVTAFHPRLGRRSLLAALAWAMLVVAVHAEAPEEVFARGNAAYEEGRYEDARNLYRSLLRAPLEDSRLEYNLANAEFRLNRLGHAILHYERARRLDPTDPDIRGNLELARSLAFDRVEALAEPSALRWLHTVQDRVGPDRQAWIMLALTWLAAGLIAAAASRLGGWSGWVGWATSGILVLATLCAVSWYTTYQRLEGTSRAVVLDEVAEVLAGPAENNPALFTVHEGLILEVLSERQEWVQVSLPNGFNGWISRQALEVV